MGRNSTTQASFATGKGLSFRVMLLLLAGILAMMFFKVFVPGLTLFSNDGPLDRLMAESHRLPARFTGCWGDLNSIGCREASALTDFSFALQWLLGPVTFSKLYTPLALLGLGVGAWLFFRQSGLAPAACLLGGLGAALNSSFFSLACWGVAGEVFSVGLTFVALAALAGSSAKFPGWVCILWAGLAVGLAVAEGADVGALFSVVLALFAVYQAWAAEGPRTKRIAGGVARVALIAVCAGLVAAQAISELVITNIEGVTGAKQDMRTREERWDWATWWSLPKREVLSLAVPGLFGYRMDTSGGGSYWGSIGRNRAWDGYVAGGNQPAPSGFARYTGGGFYTGVIVLLVAAYAGAQALRRQTSVFNLAERRLLWFWLGLSLVSLLLAFGRYAPFYRWFYGLPYASTIRNPIKFLHVMSLSLVVLFAYGLDGLWRKYMTPAKGVPAPRSVAWHLWWQRADRFEKAWVWSLVPAPRRDVAGLDNLFLAPGITDWLLALGSNRRRTRTPRGALQCAPGRLVCAFLCVGISGNPPDF